jgi:Zn-finger protein
MARHDGAFKGFTNTGCEFFPCHPGVRREFNCLFCYCPLTERACPGPYKTFTDKYGNVRKDCSDCTLPHDSIGASWRFIQMWVSTAPAWDRQPQSRERIHAFSRDVKARFDREDIEWANRQLDPGT